MNPKATIIILIIVCLLGASIFWLWQRQPKVKSAQTSAQTTTQQSTDTTAQNDSLQITAPKNESIVTTSKTSINGKTQTASYVVIYSNSINTVVKSDKDGNFQTDINLTDGLNLISIQTITGDPQKRITKSLTIWSAKKDPGASAVYAGSVKNIFDTVLTITTQNGDKTVNTSKSTQVNLPNGEEEQAIKQATASANQKIRIGDFAIALGDPAQSGNKDTITGRSIQIIRDNKPQNNEDFVAGTTLTGVKLNLFSAKSVVDSKIWEFTLNKNTSIQLNGQDAKQDAVVKDKNAIIIFHKEDDKKVADLVYLTN